MLTFEEVEAIYNQMRANCVAAEEEAERARLVYHQARFRERCLQARVIRQQNRTRERTRLMMAAEARLQEAREREWRAEHYMTQHRFLEPDEEILNLEEVLNLDLPEPPAVEIPTPPTPATRRILSPRHFVPLESSTPARRGRGRTHPAAPIEAPDVVSSTTAGFNLARRSGPMWARGSLASDHVVVEEPPASPEQDD